MQTTIGQRFILFLKSKKLQQKDFCDRTGYSERTLSNIVNDKTKNPKADFFATILKHYPELNIKWLILGDGDMWGEKEAKKIKSAEKTDQHNLIKRLEALEKKEKKRDKNNTSMKKLVALMISDMEQFKGILLKMGKDIEILIEED